MNIVLAIIPSIIIGILIYKADKVEKEPKKEIIKAFLLGCLSIILTLIVSLILKINEIELNYNSISQILIYSFIDIALIEEFSKWLISILFLRKNKNYNYIFDSIVYTVFIALGFATIENILYAVDNDIAVILIRAITTVPAHVFFAVSLGYYISKYKEKPKFTTLLLSLIVPTLLHGFYDFCLLSENTILYLIYLLFVICLYIFSIKRIKILMENDKQFN